MYAVIHDLRHIYDYMNLRINELWHTCEWVMSHTWTSHGTNEWHHTLHESRHIYEYVMAHTMSHGTYMNESRPWLVHICAKTHDHDSYRVILIVGLTNEYRSNVYQNCSVVKLAFDWARSVIHLNVPGEKTKKLSLPRTSQLARTIGKQNQSIHLYALTYDVFMCVSHVTYTNESWPWLIHISTWPNP